MGTTYLETRPRYGARAGKGRYSRLCSVERYAVRASSACTVRGPTTSTRIGCGAMWSRPAIPTFESGRASRRGVLCARGECGRVTGLRAVAPVEGRRRGIREVVDSDSEHLCLL